MFESHASDKGLISKNVNNSYNSIAKTTTVTETAATINTTPQKKKFNPKNERKIRTDVFPKETHRWAGGT